MAAVAGVICLAGLPALADPLLNLSSNAAVRVVSVKDSNAIFDFQPNDVVVQTMVNRGLTNLTGKANIPEAWRSLISTNDIVGIKVFSAAGMLSGTRPAVVAAVIHGLLDAGLPPANIIIWDRHADALRAAGFFKLGQQLGVRVAGAAETGYDPANFYLPDSPVIGNLVWGDLEFGKKGADVGKKSFVSKLVSRQITRIISIAPLLNQEDAGTCGHLYSLALGSVDNTFRFEGDPDRLAVAVPEICALPLLGDRGALDITDALIAQYEGGARGLLQYSSVLNQLWFSRDPVALDTLAMKELDKRRRATGAPESKPNLELYANATLLQLGVNDPAKIRVKNIP
ncbi:MAG TPA: hypothetical protein VK840_05630 [Candidatus Dormibacteraeota bacterium]|nr:hypothetical protein [Candidatus Dormibacteraeota bacterium]